ncbi:TIGR00730 family Rossman fold protein [Bacteriovoracaceae bacterium]|nr:TIGR00730 family Rossman fold protein [Bacteriovoracaceae bacterium]
MKSICVYCASNDNLHEDYKEGARIVGKEIASRGIRIVYGGARVGLMGIVANSALEHGGEVTGVFPKFMSEQELVHEGLTELIVVETMHERKAKMAELSDAMIALPGGVGTLEEIVEVMTWANLGLHNKPLGFLNIREFYTPLMSFFKKMDDEGFLRFSAEDPLTNSIYSKSTKDRLYYHHDDVKMLLDLLVKR